MGKDLSVQVNPLSKKNNLISREAEEWSTIFFYSTVMYIFGLSKDPY